MGINEAMTNGSKEEQTGESYAIEITGKHRTAQNVVEAKWGYIRRDAVCNRT